MFIRMAALLAVVLVSACTTTTGSGNSQMYGEIQSGVETSKTF